MKALIFGVSGQDGPYLTTLCQEQGLEVIGVSRSSSGEKCDVTSYEHVERLIQTHQPEYVFHLAANSTTRHSALFENHATISTGTLNILEAVKVHSPTSKIFITGSGLQFRNEGLPLAETAPFEASSSYAYARISSVYAARYYRSLGLKVYVGYLFHHDSPLRPENHVSQLIARAARRIGDGSDEVLEIGDIRVRKEWGFAGDIVRGIWHLVQQDELFEATIGTGVTYSIEEWLEACFSLVGKNWRDHVRMREGFQAEYSCLVSDSTSMLALGWKPEVSFGALARLMVHEGNA